jgi:hypothetical protein
MSFINESELSRYRERTKTFTKDNIINLKESVSRDRSRPLIFISHKHDEVVILQDVIAFLKKEGVDVYVDWMDDEMPTYTNALTAILLKLKINVADKFILVATPNAINSKWCNWELGLGDAAKYIDDIALFPIIKKGQSFNGAEYLKIYSVIEYQDGTTKYSSGVYIPKGYYVLYPALNGQRTLYSIKDWLKRNI